MSYEYYLNRYLNKLAVIVVILLPLTTFIVFSILMPIIAVIIFLSVFIIFIPPYIMFLVNKRKVK